MGNSEIAPKTEAVPITPQSLLDMLKDLRDQDAKSGGGLTLSKFDLIVFLEQSRQYSLGVFKEIYQDMPKEVQDRILIELLNYAITSDDDERGEQHRQEMAALLTLGCAQGFEGLGPEAQEALAMVAQELRHYYGQEDGDEEFPCWSRRSGH